MVILDTDFLSSFFKIRKLNLILKVLDLKYMIILSTVHEELKDAKFFDEIVSFFAFKEEDLDENRFILVKDVDLTLLKNDFTDEEIISLGKGELGCFLLAKKNSDSVLIDDQKARFVAKEKYLKVVSVPAFLLYCKIKAVVSLDEMKQVVEDLKNKDYYKFSDEVKKMLLE